MARLTQNLVERSRIAFRQRPIDQNTKFEKKSRWRAAAILKMVYRYKSAGNNPISMKFGVPT